MSWELSALTLLSLSAVGFWGLGSPQPFHRKAFYILVSASAVLVDPRQAIARMYTGAHEAFLDYQLDALLAQHFKMALTFGAVLWLLHRGWQTLWKPVPELINILGVDIPEPPDVSLAGIRSDAATLSWTRPTSNRPVQKYAIQVNGVHVGDSPGNEVAITVTGLKPNHYYNVRVVAVGPNNFQAGSALLRLRTFGKDGRPLLGNSRLPTNFTDPEQPRLNPGDEESDDSDDALFPMPTVEAAPVLNDSSANSREPNGTVPGQRRNTINRRHSPSVASLDQPHIKLPIFDGPEMSLDELNCKFEGIRKEIDDTLTLYAKDEADSQQQEEELKGEKERKRQMLKEKEEQTTQLKALVRTTMEQMRGAEKDRAKKEQQLRDKETKKSKVRDNVSKLDTETLRMKRDRETFEAQKTALAEKRDSDARKLDEINVELLDKCAELEAELKDKGKQLQDLKAAREELPDAPDEQWKEEDFKLRRDWDVRRKDLHARWAAESKGTYELDQQIHMLSKQLRMEQSNLEFLNQGVASTVDFEMSPPPRPRRLSNANMSSPSPVMPSEPGYPPPAGFSNAGFGPALFMDMTATHGQGEPQTEAELREANGPLSPSAARSFLPSNIFDEMEEPDLKHGDSFLPESISQGEDEDVQSPASASPPFNLFASPHGSSQNLPFPQYAENDDRQPSLTSPGIIHSATSPPTTGHRLSNFLAVLRNRGPKPADDMGPALGSLKSGQSQSFPRGTDEQEVLENRRKINFSSWMNRNSTGPDNFTGTPFASSRPFSVRRLIPFGNNSSGVFGEGDVDGSRPASIASIDLPRPSTDSGSIWGVQGEQGGLLGTKNRLWSPDNRWPSRSGSRRPSIHGSPSILTTTLASAEDVILDEDDLLDPQTSPSQIGVIGSRPPTALKSLNQRLNPAAPTFFGYYPSESDADGAQSRDGSRNKAKGNRSKGKEPAIPGMEFSHFLDDSPSDTRKSRDARSIHTQNSVTESHESLALDATLSNTPSDLHSNADSAPKDADSVVMKLFRKGSSSKFGLSNRLVKDSGLFKKGPGSATHSDRNASVDHRSSIGDIDDLGEDTSQLGRSYDSVGSSPSLGPAKSRDSKESRISGWRFMKKKGKDSASKEKEGAEADRNHEEE
ncbi:hypothetical protein ACHAPE_005475 [Trichoderma viride]